jgi:tetratricopeptide (TPR) repeat protein
MKIIRPERTSRKAVTTQKKLLFGAITVLFPLITICLLETGLRLGGYGKDLSLFVKEDLGAKSLYVMNPEVKGRYFTHVNFTPNTSPDYFEIPKRPGAFRIFCLGGSTTVGFPYGFIGSFSSFLRQRMKALFPEIDIEIINLGMTATNSYTVLDIMHELCDYEPDLIIVYDGHNEFYGALGISSHESVGGSRWLTKLYLRLTRFKTFALLRNLIIDMKGLFGNGGTSLTSGTMMETLARHEYIPYGSGPYEKCLDNFRYNLQEIASIAKSHRVPLIFSTQVSNERDLAPFVSRNREGMPKDLVEQYNRAVDSITALAGQPHPDVIMPIARRLLALDGSRADVRFRYAGALRASGDMTAARAEYRLARDYDELRFRTSGDFNNAIRAMLDPPNVFIADVEQSFENLSPDSIVGTNLILEHLHPNISGYFLIGKIYAHLMKEAGIAAPRALWNERDTISDTFFRNHISMTALDMRAADRRIAVLTGGWPFDHPLPPATSPLQPEVESIVGQLVGGKMTWEEAHVATAEYYTKGKDIPHAEAEYRALIDQFPANVSAYLFLAKLHLDNHNNGEAQQLLTRSLEVEPTPLAYRLLGAIALESGKTGEAIALDSRAIDISQDPSELVHSHYALALALYRSRDTVRSLQEIDQALALSPSFAPARRLRDLLIK